MRTRAQQLWDKLRDAVLDGTFNQNNKWKMLTSKTFLSRLQQEKYLEEVDNFFRSAQREVFARLTLLKRCRSSLSREPAY